MSYAYDVMRRVFNEHIAPHVDYRIGWEFGMLIEEMHSANHKLDDGINKDPGVSRQARELEKAAKGEKE